MELYMLRTLKRYLSARLSNNSFSAPRGYDLSSWESDGYIKIDHFFSGERIEELRAELDRLWKERRSAVNPYVIDVFIGTPNERRITFRSAPDDSRRYPYKLNDLFLDNTLIQDTVLDERLVNILRFLLQSDPVVCNSLTFEHGSQQRLHFDTFFMPPATSNKMLATWIALDPVTSTNGPLSYVPGSHKIAPYRFSNSSTHAVPDEMPAFDKYIESELSRNNLEPVSLEAEPGDLFIWHAQLYHGGKQIEDPSQTRRSIVTHYFTTIDVSPKHRWDIGSGRFVLRRGHQPAQDW